MQADRTYGGRPRRVLVLGGTGTIGRATVRALVARGHEVVCLARRTSARSAPPHLSGAQLRACDVTDPASLARDGIRGERFDAVLSCLASRTGAPDDAWRIDHDAHLDALRQAQAAGIPHMILLSAICVQKPQLAFQKAKLAFEHSLIASGIDYSIVRPTAFFKSLSGQVERVRQGKPFVMFGDGTLTACKPISDGDLAAYLADCIDNPERRNRILPIGGPGPAITPRMQGEALFAMLGQPPRFKHVPVALLDAIVLMLGTMGRVVPSLRTKAELARIGRYYATESMLVLNPETGFYDAEATPSTGSETLFDYYAQLLSGEAQAERGEHAVF
ncbi:NAD(P)H-binding protein [Alteriqipengyuania sp. NZ-12B]|uniref:Divinyl chlorophyllide a 8-vinyl-reductase, chloroplastic n=1 Tax=Alteriqipengyuania abyssalis TaxID=2860200 RepID=A0ABS7PF01_9SPHN|nr:NAD(P)H-binding protein [Alteriqipengyuania abyssalis]MBY8337668.1 NAD(P)H-binding protein [Alteriqipengyuania abyssalis]